MRTTLILLAAMALVLVACTESADLFEVDATPTTTVATPVTADAPTTTSTTEPGTTTSVLNGGVVDDSIVEGLVAYGDRSRDHRDGIIEYDIVPPPGGDHAPFWLICDVYDEPVPTEYAVHSLEHGAVWLTYDPELSPDDVAAVEALAGIFPRYVIVSPFPENPGAVVATAWGHQFTTEDPGDNRLQVFVEEFAGGAQGGEPGAPCVQSGVTPDQALRERDGTVDA